MVNPIGSAGANRAVDTLRADASKRAAAVRPSSIEGGAPTSGPVAALAAGGAPIDGAKVAAIRAAIAGGGYTIDPRAIADRMIALDLPAGA